MEIAGRANFLEVLQRSRLEKAIDKENSLFIFKYGRNDSMCVDVNDPVEKKISLKEECDYPPLKWEGDNV